METNRKRAYSCWSRMYDRCYNPKCKDYKSYGAVGVTMCNEWNIFENFYSWYLDNYYEVDGEYMAVDKDIIGDGMQYNPQNCIIVPFRINGMFVSKEKGAMRGVVLKSGKYEVKVRNTVTGENEYHGRFQTMEKAQEIYLECKRTIIRGVIEEYKDKLPLDVYNKLLTFKLGV